MSKQTNKCLIKQVTKFPKRTQTLHLTHSDIYSVNFFFHCEDAKIKFGHIEFLILNLKEGKILIS